MTDLEQFAAFLDLYDSELLTSDDKTALLELATASDAEPTPDELEWTPPAGYGKARVREFREERGLL